MDGAYPEIYFCIDQKSFYASVECVERQLDPMTALLVVADAERSKNTICLAVSVGCKKKGIKNRCRLGDIPPNMNVIVAPPQMQLYIDCAAEIHGVFLKYFAPEDIYTYSIDESFLHVTPYLKMYGLPPRALAAKVIADIKATVGTLSTCGIGSNLYLAKVSLDILAKHSPDFIAELTEESYRKKLWQHRPLTDFWRVGQGTANRLRNHGITTMQGITESNPDNLYKLFGINAELLIDHAWGREPCTIADIKAYKSSSKSLSSSQVLMRTISSVIKTVWNTIKNTISNVVNGIKTTVTNVWNGIKNTISSILDAISTTVTNIWSSIKNFVSETVEKIKTTVTNIFTTMKTKVVDTVSNLKQDIVDTFNGIKEKFSNIGKNIIDGIIGGITGKATELYDTVKDTMTGLLDKAKETLGIHSPSKVAKKQIGEQFANGVIEGVKARKGEAKKSAAELSKDIVEAAEKKLDWLETFNKISVADEVSYWKKILGATKKGTDAYLQAYKNYVRAKEDANAKILSDAEKEMDVMQTYNKITLKGEYEYWKSLLKQLKKGSDEYLQAYKNMVSAKESYTKELESIETEYAENINGVYEELQNNISNLTKAYDDQVEATKKSLTSAFSLFDKYEIKLDKTGQDLIESLESQVGALSEFSNRMSALESRNILPKDLIQNLREMGVDATDELIALNSMTDTQLSQYATLWKMRNQLALDEAKRENEKAYNRLQKDLTQAKKDAVEKIDDFTDEYKRKLAELEGTSYSSSTKVGQSTMQGIVDGINSSSKKVNNTVSSTLNVVSSYISKMQKQVKTSTTNIMKVIANSITDIYERVTICIGNMEDSIISSVNRMIGSLSNLIVLIKDIDNQDFVRYNSNIIGSMGKNNVNEIKSSGKDNNEQKDIVQRTYVFYTNKPIDEIEAARQLKKTERDIAEGFA